MNSTVIEEYVDRLLESSASGHADKVLSMLRGVVNVNVRNERGWTSLMFAARNGHANVVQCLLDKGCDTEMLNTSGHTALDIARFWNHQNVVDLLSPDRKDASPPVLSNKKETVNFFCANPLDRAADKRKNNDWLTETMRKPTSKYLLLSDLQVLVISSSQSSAGSPQTNKKLCIAQYSQLEKYLETKPLWIFLGLEDMKASTSILDSENNSDSELEDKTAWFSVDISSWSEEDLKLIHPQGELLSLFPGGMTLEGGEAAIFGQARSLMAWHDRYQFCPTCGAKTGVEESGYKRHCSNDKCRSLKGVHNTSYPRLDPTVIMAVVSSGGDKLLLGRAKRFPTGMYSCLAGFMEPGESIEDACRREVKEESGVIVGRVEYHSCQSWPMPASLMIGCIAHATRDHIQVDKDELDEAHWFSREDIVHMLTKKHPQGLYIPPEQAIAHILIRAWVNMSSNL